MNSRPISITTQDRLFQMFVSQQHFRFQNLRIHLQNGFWATPALPFEQNLNTPIVWYLKERQEGKFGNKC